jgi:hypothetical protein
MLLPHKPAAASAQAGSSIRTSRQQHPHKPAAACRQHLPHICRQQQQQQQHDSSAADEVQQPAQ